MKNALPPFCFPLLGAVVLGLSLSSATRPQEPKPADPSSTAFRPADKNESKNQPTFSDSGTQATSSNKPGANPTKPEDQAQQFYESATNLYAAGKIDEAIAAFLQAAKHKPNDAPTHYGLGMAYAKSKSYKNAEESFQQAVKLKPDWPEAHFRVGLMAYVLGNKTKANEVYNKLRRLNSPLANTLRRVISETSASPAAGEPGSETANPPSEILEVSEPATASEKASEQGPATQTEPASAEPVPAQPLSAGSKTSTDSHTTSALPTAEEALTSVYRVGVGDTLDIRLINSATPRSTLYTVMDGGIIDFPIGGGPITVAGLTTDEIQARIAAELKRRAVEVNAHVSVGVRHYSSHAVIVTGLVANPGTRFLRREAIPLYVLMAEVQPRLDAGRITILRAGGEGRTFDLTDTNALGTLIRPGDVLNVGPKQQEFYYIGGRVTHPGQKSFQPGITLLQAILAAGGPTENYDNIDLSREGADGRLNTTRLKLKEIKSGKIQDLKLKPGDRIEIVR